MDRLGAQYRGPSQQIILQITLRNESDNQKFNIEIEQSMYVQELIEQVRGQLNIPERKRIILKQGSNRLEENRHFSSYGFPQQVLIDIIIEDANQTVQRQQDEKSQLLQKQLVQQQPRQQSDISTKQNSEIDDKEIMLVIKVPTQNKIFNVQMPESTKIEQLINQLKQFSILELGKQDKLQIRYQGYILNLESSLKKHGIQKGSELIVEIETSGG